MTRCVPAFWSRGCIFPHGSSGMSGYVNLVGMAAIYNAIQTPMVRVPSLSRAATRRTHPGCKTPCVITAATCPTCASAPCRPCVQLIVFPSLGSRPTAVLDWLVNARLVAMEPWNLSAPPVCEAWLRPCVPMLQPHVSV